VIIVQVRSHSPFGILPVFSRAGAKVNRRPSFSTRVGSLVLFIPSVDCAIIEAADQQTRSLQSLKLKTLHTYENKNESSKPNR